MTRVAIGFAAALVLGISGLLTLLPSSTAVTQCTKVASTTGSDSAAGSATSPYRTAGKLVASLRSGETGCLRAGVYQQDVTIDTAGITLASYPGERATLIGRLYVRSGANNVLVTELNLNGKNAALLPSPTVNANDVRFVANNVTNDNTGICFIIGSNSYGRAQRTILRGNRIRRCGRVPSTNKDHGIYVQAADYTQIVDNVIVDNVDRGIQLYPDAQRTTIRGNIIDGNGEGVIFSGLGTSSSNNTVVGNLITFSRLRHDVESWYPLDTLPGIGNTVSGNCIYGGAEGPIGNQVGFTATNNTIANPGYRSRSTGDYRISSTSPCAAIIRASLAPAGPNGEPVVTTATTTPTWQPAVGARVKITRSSSPDFGRVGEISYLSVDRRRALLLMDAVTVRAVLVADIGPA